MSMAEVDGEIAREIGRRAGIPDDVVSMAVDILNHVDMRYGDGRGYPGAVYAAARAKGYPITPGDIADACDPGDVPIIESLSQPKQAIDREMRRVADAHGFDPDNPEPYVSRVCDRLAAPGQLYDTAVSIAKKGRKRGLADGKSVHGYAAAAVYAAGHVLGDHVDQHDVARVAGVSPVTIRNQYRDLMHVDERPPTLPDRVGDVVDGLDGVPDVVRSDSRELAKQIDDTEPAEFRGCGIDGIAAAVVYAVADDNRVDVSQTDVAHAAGVHKGTVINRLQDVRSWRDRVDAVESMRYNDMKNAAARRGLDVGATPERDYLIDRLIADGFDPHD